MIHTMRRLLLKTLAALLALAVLVVIGGYLYLRLSLPQVRSAASKGTRASRMKPTVRPGRTRPQERLAYA